MAGNDLDYVIHVMYEKFTENQKNKKYENRIYMAEEEFKQELKDFVKKSSIEDKGLLISEIYRSISEDVLEISSDGKITVSPKVLRTVEKKIQDKKEREEQLNAKKVVQENDEIKLDIGKTSISEISHEQYMKLSYEEKVEVIANALEGLGEKYGITYGEDEAKAVLSLANENFSTDPATIEAQKTEQIKEILVTENAENENSQDASEIKELFDKAFEIKRKMLTGVLGEIFIRDGKFDAELLARVAKGLKLNPSLQLKVIIYNACKQHQSMSKEEVNALTALANEIDKEDFIEQMSVLVEAQSTIDGLKPFCEEVKEVPPEVRVKKIEEVSSLIESFKKIESLIQPKSDVPENQRKDELGKALKAVNATRRKSFSVTHTEKTTGVVDDNVRRKNVYEESRKEESAYIGPSVLKEHLARIRGRKLGVTRKKAEENFAILGIAKNPEAVRVRKKNNNGKDEVAYKIPVKGPQKDAKVLLDKISNMEKELLEGKLGQIFIKNGKINVELIARVSKALRENNNSNLSLLISNEARKCDLDNEKVFNIVQATKDMAPEELKNQILFLINTGMVKGTLEWNKNPSVEFVDEKKEEVQILTEIFEKMKTGKGDITSGFEVLEEKRKKRLFLASEPPKDKYSYVQGVADKLLGIQTELLVGDIGKIFVHNGKINEEFLYRVIQGISNNESLNLPLIINNATRVLGLDNQKINDIMQVVKSTESTELKSQILLFAETTSLIDDLNMFDQRLRNISPEMRAEKIKLLESSVDEMVDRNNKKRVDETEINVESLGASAEENEISLEDAQIGDFDVDSFSAMFEDMRVDAIEAPVVDHQDISVEPTSESVVVQNDNNAVHVETITVAEPDEKVAQQVVEQPEERKDESAMQNNLLKEVTWVDRAKQGLFKFGKTLSSVVKAVTNKDKSKGVFERIAEAINSEGTSSSDTTNSSSSSATAGPGVDEKTSQNHVDYLNTQFNVNVRQAAESAKIAAETNKGITSEESTHDDELV